ncbi:MAG TPA: amidohydrolase family protein, partial [Methanocorpusculum sp.]|nr:amidohydrolase family protein [Methanocorpusculum sp.]
GISTGVVSSSIAIELLPKEEAVKYARLTNDAVAEAMKQYPGRFLGTISLPTPYLEESIAELERCVNELGLQYWHTHSNYGDEYLYEEKFEPLLAKCAELDVPVYLHPAYPSDEYLLDSGTSFAGATFGFGVDVMKTSYRLIVSGIFDRYPNLTLILGHMGEYYPYSLTRMDNRLLDGDTYLKCKENLTYYFDNKNVLITTSGITDPNTIDCAIKAIGIDSIMFASDYPYENVKNEVEFIKSLPISDEDKDKIFYKNAEKYVFKDRSQTTA